MKNLKLFLSVVFAILFFNSCENEEDLFTEDVTADVEVLSNNTNESANKGPTITFGRYYGKCLGNACVEVFKLIDTTLLEDTADNYPGSGAFYLGDFVSFKGSDRIKTDDILFNFPLELLDSKLITYGTPDAGDWGGIYLEYQDGIQHRYWFLDLNLGNNPKYLRAYVVLIDEKVSELREINNLN